MKQPTCQRFTEQSCPELPLMLNLDTRTSPEFRLAASNLVAVSGDWNKVQAVKGGRPLFDQETFAVTPQRNEQVGIGLSVNGRAAQGLRFNDDTWGLYLDAKTAQYGAAEVRSSYTLLAGERNDALRLTLKCAENKAVFTAPNSAPVEFDLPAHFAGLPLYPVVQVWNSNSAKFQTDASMCPAGEGTGIPVLSLQSAAANILPSPTYTTGSSGSDESRTWKTATVVIAALTALCALVGLAVCMRKYQRKHATLAPFSDLRTADSPAHLPQYPETNENVEPDTAPPPAYPFATNTDADTAVSIHFAKEVPV